MPHVDIVWKSFVRLDLLEVILVEMTYNTSMSMSVRKCDFFYYKRKNIHSPKILDKSSIFSPLKIYLRS